MREAKLTVPVTEPCLLQLQLHVFSTEYNETMSAFPLMGKVKMVLYQFFEIIPFFCKMSWLNMVTFGDPSQLPKYSHKTLTNIERILISPNGNKTNSSLPNSSAN